MFGQPSLGQTNGHPVLGQAVPMPMSPNQVPPSAMPPAPEGAGSTSEHDSMMQCVAGGIALLGLIILPLVLK
jgi:hypothetical protein